MFACTALVAPVSAVAQGERPRAAEQAIIYGQIVDQTSGRPAAGLPVTLLPIGSEAESNAGGRFEFRNVPQGAYVIEVRTDALVRSDSIRVEGGRVYDVRVPVPLTAIPLAPIEVHVASRHLELIGFFDRRRHENGYFLTAAEIETMAGVLEFTDVVKRLPSVFIHSTNAGRRMVLFRRQVGSVIAGQGCEPALYLDGLRVRTNSQRPYNSDFNLAGPQELAAVEVYVGARAPSQYRTDPCGAVLLWTKR